MRHSYAQRALAVLFSATLAASGVPTYAQAATSAELRAQLQEAQTKLQTMAEQTAAAGEELNDTLYQIEQTKGQISETSAEIEAKQVELKEAQAILADRVASNYKAGSTSLLSLVLESTSFEEFVSSIYYADKVTARDAEVIQTVKDVRAELNEKKDSLAQLESDQETLADQQKTQKESLEKQQAAQQEYVAGLSAEVQAKLEEERQAEIARQEAERKAAQEAAARAAAEADARRREEEARRQAEEAQQVEQEPQQESETPSGGETSYEGGTTTPVVTPVVVSGDARQTIVNAAYSQLGVGYSYGASSPGVAFDCSGLTSWCYAQAGITIPHSSAGQAGYVTPTDDLQPGDLVIWLGGVNSGSGNHVALYVGNGQIIHANGSYVKLDNLAERDSYTIAGSVL